MTMTNNTGSKKSKRLTITRLIVITFVVLTIHFVLWQPFEISSQISAINSNIRFDVTAVKPENTATTGTTSDRSTNTSRFADTFTDDISTNFTFAACLLIKDDTGRLPEWLAYHYTVLPLRRLIIAVDPYSVATPRHIAQEFQNEIGLNTTIWGDDDYMVNDFNKRNRWGVYGKANPEGTLYTVREIYDAHIWRQKVFLTKCVQQLWREGHSWIILVDSDEFVTFNWYRPDIEGTPLFCTLKAESSSGRRKQVNQTILEECHSQYKRDIQSGVMPRGRLPPFLNSTTIAEFIEQNIDTVDEWYLRSCIVIPRLMFGGTDLPPSPDLQALYKRHSGLANDTLHTLRFRQHGMDSAHGKSIVDVSRIDPSQRFIDNPHRVFLNDCQSGPIPKYSQSLFRAHHYTGGLEDFLRLGVGFRRTEEEYKNRNSFQTGVESDEMITWFDAFVKKVGSDRALYLTQTLRRQAIEEYTKILSLPENMTDLLPRPFMPSAAYLEEYRKNFTARMESYRKRLAAASG